MNAARRNLKALRVAVRAGWLELRPALTDDHARGIADALEAVHEKVLDDLDAVYAFFTDAPEPQSLGVDAPRHGGRREAVTGTPSFPGPVETPGRVTSRGALVLIEGGKA